MSQADFTSGHRNRLRQRFMKAGVDGVADYELLELVLYAAKPRGDVKPLAKELIKTFGSFYSVMSADPAELTRVKGMGEACVTSLKVVQAAAQHMLRFEATSGPVIASWQKVIDYCRASMDHLKNEELRLLFLDRHNRLISDEVQQRGTIDHTPVYTREVIKRALEIGASAMILVHNHPSGDPTPSQADIEVTRRIKEAAENLGISLHDHIIIAKGKYCSLRAENLM